MRELSLAQLRAFAVARSLFAPTTLTRALHKIGFLQADPIRAPARAQDLILRHRVKHYRAGDLERRYARLPIEEDFFINYGFLARGSYALMHPRAALRPWDRTQQKRATQLMAYVREHGVVHPRAVEAYFALGNVTNYWGGSSSATTHLLDALQYRGLLRVVRREQGIRLYAAQPAWTRVASASERKQRLDALVDVLVTAYAPLPKASLHQLVLRLRYAVPQWRAQLPAALARAKERLGHARLAGGDWYWPADEQAHKAVHLREANAERVRLLAPFDPLVWDRRRFELFWGWAYRFEAYTPESKRKLGYYALPLLWRDHVIGWANVSLRGGALETSLGFTQARPNEPAFERALEAELAHLRAFLGSGSGEA
jgi:uncharacterized protein YcaQ